MIVAGQLSLTAVATGHTRHSPRFSRPRIFLLFPRRPTTSSRADTTRVTQPVSPAAPWSVGSLGRTLARTLAPTHESNAAQIPAAKPCFNRCFTATFSVSTGCRMLSSLCRPRGRRVPPAARARSPPRIPPRCGLHPGFLRRLGRRKGRAAWASGVFPCGGAPDFRCNSCDRTNRYTLVPDRHRTLQRPVD